MLSWVGRVLVVDLQNKGHHFNNLTVNCIVLGIITSFLFSNSIASSEFKRR